MEKSHDKPLSNSAVRLPMTKNVAEVRNVTSRGVKKITNCITYLRYACSLTSICRESGIIAFGKCSGCSNSFRHLKWCLSRDSVQQLIDLYKNALYKKRCNVSIDIHSCFSSMVSVTDINKAMYSHVMNIEMLGNPVCHLEDTIVRKFSKYDINFLHKRFNEWLLEWTKLVENRIKIVLLNTRGSIMYDVWINYKKCWINPFISKPFE